jgi:NAD(P)-dependent dehydrogenase (short-subunit alcohol dehydrogenase family)
VEPLTFDLRARSIEQAFAGKRGVVTGAGSGIGRAIALRIVAAGGQVAALDRDLHAVEQLAGEVEGLAGALSPFGCDISVVDQVDDAIDSLLAGGYTDFLANAAGTADTGHSLQDVSVSQWDKLMDINLRGTFLMMRGLISEMRKNRNGSIVNIGSSASLLGVPELSSYTASKHAVVGLSKSVVAESAAFNVRINVIAPGPIDTPLQQRAERESADSAEFRRRQEAAIPQGRYGLPEEVAELAAFLLSDHAAYVNGAVVTIDGGLTATI